MKLDCVTKFGCDQCEPMMINHIFCHEGGCPNAKKTWVADEGWVLFLECFDCGFEVRDGEVCGCREAE